LGGCPHVSLQSFNLGGLGGGGLGAGGVGL
jgi:hypothetical protein